MSHWGVRLLGSSYLLAFFLCGCGHEVDASLSSGLADKVEAILVEEMAKQRIPGLSASIAIDGKIAWSKGLGQSDLENSVSARPETVFRIASISKTMTAVAVMQLAERGKLDLNMPVQRYCPAFPEKRWPVTSRQLLGHLGGVRHYREDELAHPSTRHYTDIMTPLDIFKHDPLVSQPGSTYTYTTYGFNVLGCAVEGAAGSSFMDYLKKELFAPAGMTSTQADDLQAIIPHRAQGYRLGDDGRVLNSELADTSNKIPGGGLSSTADDLVRFATATFNDSLIKAATRTEMLTEQSTTDGRATEYGLGWILGTRNGRREMWHTGSQERVSTVLYLVPEKKISIALLCNLEDGKMKEVARRILDILP